MGRCKKYWLYETKQSFDMMRHYFLLGYRNISKHLVVSFVTVIGYALATSIALPVILLLLEQGNFDNFHENTDKIFRVTTETNDSQYRWATSPGPLEEHIRDNFGSVKSVHSLFPKELNMGIGNNNSFLFRAAFVDNKFFDVFKLSDKTTDELGLSHPFTIVLTEDAAIKLFGSGQAIGKVVSIDSVGDVVVTGILKKKEIKTHIDFEAYLSLSTARILGNKSRLFSKEFEWASYQTIYTYIVIKSGISESTINGALDKLSKSLFKSKAFYNSSIHSISFRIQPIKDIIKGGLYHDTLIVRVQPNTSIYIIMGLILFSLASINYLNLFVTRASMRIKEVGVRRIFGVGKRYIFFQFMIESIILLSISSLLGFALMLILPIIQIQNIVNSSSFDASFILMFLTFTIVMGTVAGLIPSLFVSNVRITTTLKTAAKNVRFFGVGFQKILLFFQLSSSIVISIVLFVVVLQSNFMSKSDYGFQMKGLLILDLQGMQGETIENEVSRLAGINRTSLASDIFGMMPGVIDVKKSKDASQVVFYKYSVGNSFLDLFDLRLQAGKNFKTGSANPGRQIILNETAVKALSYDWPNSIIGENIIVNDTVESVVVGVIRDFHYDNFNRPILPLVLQENPNEGRYLIMEVADERKIDEMKAQVGLLWRGISPNIPAKIENYDEMFKERQSYRNDVRLLLVITLYTVGICLLGLLGITMHSMAVRSNEISIHKILGANTGNLVILLSKDFGKIFLIAIAISLMAGFLISRVMLQQFAYKIDLTISVFLLPILAVIFFASSIVILRSLAAASTNPIDNLRHE